MSVISFFITSISSLRDEPWFGFNSDRYSLIKSSITSLVWPLIKRATMIPPRLSTAHSAEIIAISWSVLINPQLSSAPPITAGVHVWKSCRLFLLIQIYSTNTKSRIIYLSRLTKRLLKFFTAFYGFHLSHAFMCVGVPETTGPCTLLSASKNSLERPTGRKSRSNTSLGVIEPVCLARGPWRRISTLRWGIILGCLSRNLYRTVAYPISCCCRMTFQGFVLKSLMLFLSQLSQ